MTLNVNGTFHVVEVHQVIYSMVIGWGFMVFGILLNLLYYMVHDSFYLVIIFNHLKIHPAEVGVKTSQKWETFIFGRRYGGLNI